MNEHRRAALEALNLIVAPHRAHIPNGYARARDDLFDESCTWLRIPNTQALGIGSRHVRGRDTGEKALRIYVAKRRPFSEADVRLPPSFKVPWIREPVQIDVVELGELVLQNSMEGPVTPAVPGCAISNFGRPAGTLGCLVKEQGSTQQYILSAAHVIANNTFGIPGMVVVQPGVEGSPSRVVGKLQRWGQLDFTKGTFNNLFDAAIATVDPGTAKPEINEIGRQNGYSLDVAEEDVVRKSGARTLVRSGKVRDVDFTCTFKYFHPDDGTAHVAGFYRQVLCDPISERGDSGSAVVNASRQILGLIIGGAEGGTVFSRIGPILNRLAISIA
jgi:hypothetical protein